MRYPFYSHLQLSGQILVFNRLFRHKFPVRLYGLIVPGHRPYFTDRFFVVKAARLWRCVRLHLRWFSLKHWKSGRFHPTYKVSTSRNE
jgi:hypothetical protein